MTEHLWIANQYVEIHGLKVIWVCVNSIENFKLKVHRNSDRYLDYPDDAIDSKVK